MNTSFMNSSFIYTKSRLLSIPKSKTYYKGSTQIRELDYDLHPYYAPPLYTALYENMSFIDKLTNVIQIKYDTMTNYQHICGKNQDEVNLYGLVSGSGQYQLDTFYNYHSFHYSMHLTPIPFISNIVMTEIHDCTSNRTYAEIVEYSDDRSVLYKLCTEYLKLGTIHYDNYIDWITECSRFLNCHWSSKSNKSLEVINKIGNDIFCTRPDPLQLTFTREVQEISDGLVTKSTLYKMHPEPTMKSSTDYVYDSKTQQLIKKQYIIYGNELTHGTVIYNSDGSIRRKFVSCVVDGSTNYQKIEYRDINGKILKLRYGISDRSRTNLRLNTGKHNKLLVDVSDVRHEEHILTGYKIALIPETNQRCVVKLGIFRNSRVAEGSGMQDFKMRCDRARVLAIATIDKDRYNFYNYHAVSGYDGSFEYVLGHIVSVPNFDTDMSNICSTGIHFFLEEKNALNYYAGITDQIINRDYLETVNCHETIEYMIMLKSVINHLEDTYIMKKAKKQWDVDSKRK